MLILGANFEEPIFLTLTEDMPAGTEMAVTLVERDGRKQMRLMFECPRSVAVTRESAKLKQPKLECAEKMRTELQRSRA